LICLRCRCTMMPSGSPSNPPTNLSCAFFQRRPPERRQRGARVSPRHRLRGEPGQGGRKIPDGIIVIPSTITGESVAAPQSAEISISSSTYLLTAAGEQTDHKLRPWRRAPCQRQDGGGRSHRESRATLRESARPWLKSAKPLVDMKCLKANLGLWSLVICSS
jgi:hypothetical protein